MRVVARLLLIAILFGCAHVTKTRPTPKGAVDVELHAGGPMAYIPGLATIPVPLSALGVSIGVLDMLDVSAHLHLTSLALFGVLGVDAGASVMPLEQDGARPAITLTGRFYGFTNFRSGFAAYLETEASVSWRYARFFGTYAAVDGLFQFKAPPIFTIAVGQELIIGRFAMQLEGRWYQPFADTYYPIVQWVGIGRQGAFGLVLGFRVRFGEGR